MDQTNTITRTVTSEDSLIIQWKVCGEPSLIFHEQAIADTFNQHVQDSQTKYLEYTLFVKKCKKEISQKIQLTLVPKQVSDSITFMDDYTINKDSLIASGLKNPTRWGNKFKILSVASGSHRLIVISHAGMIASVDQNGTSSFQFQGTPVEGKWDFRSPLTTAEKHNPSNLPEQLKIYITIQYQKN